MENGWVSFHRKSLASSVWKNPNVWMVWSWCLLKSNHEPKKIPFNGSDVELSAGQFITGIERAISEIPISAQTYRTCIAYLKSTGRITTKSTNKFTIISIVKWNEYQTKLTGRLTGKLTNHQQTTNKPLTTNNKDNNDNKESRAFSPPSLQHVKEYCLIRKNVVDAQNFVDFYEMKGWMVGKNKMKDWRAAVRTWENRDKGRSDNTEIEIPEYAKGYIK